MSQVYGQDERRGGCAPPAPDGGSESFDALLHAVQTHDRVAVAAVLAPTVRLSMPPLRVTLHGVAEVTGTIVEVAFAFDYLRYTMRSRYLAPGKVIDEAELSGVHARDLLGAPPTGRPSTVVMRVIAGYQDGLITDLAIWPDVAAVRGLCDELARHIDERQAGAAGAVVTALRASIPAGATRVVQGRARQEPALPALEAVLPVVPPAAQRLASRTQGLKVPLTRRARRRRAVVAGAAMLAVSASIVTWVAHGAAQSPGSQDLAFPNTALSASPSAPGGGSGTAATGSGSPGVSAGSTVNGESLAAPSSRPSVTPSPSSAPQSVQIVDNQVEFSADLLFDFGEATLAPRAKAQLDLLVAKVIAERRFGRIMVNGFTDDKGGTAYNLRLSRERASAVAQALQAGLARANAPIGRISSAGFGETNAKYPNTTASGRAMNRRVTVKVPSPVPLPAKPQSPAQSKAASTASKAATAPKVTGSPSGSAVAG